LNVVYDQSTHTHNTISVRRKKFTFLPIAHLSYEEKVGLMVKQEQACHIATTNSGMLVKSKCMSILFREMKKKKEVE